MLKFKQILFFCFASVNQISYFRVVLLIEKSRLDKNLKKKNNTNEKCSKNITYYVVKAKK